MLILYSISVQILEMVAINFGSSISPLLLLGLLGKHAIPCLELLAGRQELKDSNMRYIHDKFIKDYTYTLEYDMQYIEIEYIL